MSDRSPRPSRSSSLSRGRKPAGERHQIDLSDYPLNVGQRDYAVSDPLAPNVSPRIGPAPDHDAIEAGNRRIPLPYEVSTSPEPPSSDLNTSGTYTEFDQPYEKAVPAIPQQPDPSGRHLKFGELPSGAATPRYEEKSRRGSPAQSRSNSQERLGSTWAGPPGRRTTTGPYGSLGQPDASGINSAASSNPNLQFAEGDWLIDPNKSRFARVLYKIMNSSFIIRWFIFIVPILGLIWIPGIIGLTAAKNATIWTVPLQWWSAWLSVVWCTWWGGQLVFWFLPISLDKTIGSVIPETRYYITFASAIYYYLGAAGWALANWITFLPLIRLHETSDRSVSTLSLITQGLFGIWISMCLLVGEKLLIQIIAHNFHQKSYEDRIAEQKNQINMLTILYLNSHDIGRADTLDGAMKRPGNKRQMSDPKLLVKKALNLTKNAARQATTVIGTVASEIAGERVLQPNSPMSVVTNALSSQNKTKQLARRIFFSFCPSYRQSLLVDDISRCFNNREAGEHAFALFDRDGNGDATLEEIEMSCMDIHRERIALTHSMRDIDSAVGRLDSIIMTIWFVASVLIFVGLLVKNFQTMIAGAGTFILGLSWLIGTTAQEILASIIFLFIKHPYDVGDRVDIDGSSYVVKEMSLLSTVFRRVDGTITQAPHSVLNTKFVQNIRRSGAIAESFTWVVDYATPFEKIEALRSRMLEFLQAERRDFIPQIDISISDFEDQSNLKLSTDIKYKSNTQNGALKAQRRNKWVCALKLAMSELEIFGPDNHGNPSPPPADPIAYTLVPFKESVDSAAPSGGVDAKSTTTPKSPGETSLGRSPLGAVQNLRLEDPSLIVDAPEEDFIGETDPQQARLRRRQQPRTS